MIGGLTGGIEGASAAALSSVGAPHLQAFLQSQGVPDEAARAITQLGALGAGAAVGGSAGASAGLNEASHNAVMAIPILVDGVVAGGAAAARACLSSPACLNALRMGGAALVAKVASLIDPADLAQIPGFDGTNPNPSGGNTASPIAGPAGDGSTTKPGATVNPLGTPPNVIAGPVAGAGATVSPATQNGAGSTIVLNQGIPPSILGSDGQLPSGIGGLGTPVPMPPTPNPDQTAEDFARDAFNGQQPVSITPGITGPGSWLAKLPDGTTILYRPSGQGTRTDSDTASVDINNAGVRAQNNGVPAKFKFPRN